ncbi:MAG: hypothetical protein EBV03_00260 [Proteobacteria bacterium]|nr:hypothetical protein [Pseudomonadota bacterium]
MGESQPISRRSFLAMAAASLAATPGCNPRRNAAAAHGPAVAPVNPKGCLVLIGGGCQQWSLDELKAGSQTMTGDQIDPSGLYREMMQLTGKQHPRVEIITNASKNYADETAEQYQLIFDRLGGQTHTIASREPETLASDTALYNRLASADLVFITGGDQEELPRLFQQGPLYKLLRQRYVNDPGFVLAGTSAGSMAMSEHMIGGDTQDKRSCPSIVPGFGLMPAIIDTHMDSRARAHRDRRLLHAVSSCSEHIGIGLDNATGIIVKNGTVRTAGKGSVLLAVPPGCQLEAPGENRCDVKDLRDCADFNDKNLQTYRFRHGQEFALGEMNKLARPPAPLLAGSGKSR